jgi:hypothetical protein
VATPNSAGQSNEQLATGGGSYVDVRDLVAALTKSQSVPEASGERIIVNAGKHNKPRFSHIRAQAPVYRCVPLAGLECVI